MKRGVYPWRVHLEEAPHDNSDGFESAAVPPHHGRGRVCSGQPVRAGDGSAGNPVKKRVNHTLAIASLGGATMDNEWNYVQCKLIRALGAVFLENQARI